jgi:hypothetical protein
LANSRELVECIASVTGRPLASVTGHMRYLREAEPSLVTTGGRGIAAPRMTSKDAASLLCAVYGSASVQDSASTVLALKALPSSRQGIRTPRTTPYQDPLRERPPLFTLGVESPHSVIDGLAAAILIFAREEDFLPYIVPPGRRAEETGLYAKFSVHYPQFYASLTVGVHGHFSEGWVYGRRQKLKSRQICECDEDALREIAACLRLA